VFGQDDFLNFSANIARRHRHEIGRYRSVIVRRFPHQSTNAEQPGLCFGSYMPFSRSNNIFAPSSPHLSPIIPAAARTVWPNVPVGAWLLRTQGGPQRTRRTELRARAALLLRLLQAHLLAPAAVYLPAALVRLGAAAARACPDPVRRVAAPHRRPGRCRSPHRAPLVLVLTIAASRVNETASAEFVEKRHTYRPKSGKSNDFALL
jgi:hypothetical protein